MFQNPVEEAEKVNNPRLSAFAAKVRLDAFTKVKKAIEDEIKHKDFFRLRKG